MKLIKTKNKISQNKDYFNEESFVSDWNKELITLVKYSDYTMFSNAKKVNLPYQSTIDDFMKIFYTQAKTKEYVEKYLKAKQTKEYVQTSLKIEEKKQKQKTLEMFM